MKRKDVKECADCMTPLCPDDNNWGFYKYEPDIPLCEGCYDQRMEEDE